MIRFKHISFKYRVHRKGLGAAKVRHYPPNQLYFVQTQTVLTLMYLFEHILLRLQGIQSTSLCLLSR